MNIEDSPPIDAVGEHEIDYVVAQLLATSPTFRQWFVSNTVPDAEIQDYLGVITTASYAGEGESDIEFGFLTDAGERHALLVENKIDATKQPNQIERYYNRGEIRVQREDWDAFTVCLLAPERYVSPADESEFDSIVQYEEVQARLADLAHDGAAFFQDVFEASTRKSNTVDASETVAAIREGFEERTALPVTVSFDGRKRRSFQSTDPRHPDAVWYEVFIGKTGDVGRTKVRLHVESIDGLTDERRESLKSVVSQHAESLPDYDWYFHRKANLGATTVWHEETIQRSDADDYIDAIVAELHHLARTFHPIFVEEDLE